MSDYDDDDFDEQPQPKQNWRRKLEAEAEAGRKAQEDLAQARRELAFAKAGIDLNDPRMAYFVAGYKGSDDPDAIKAEAVRAGFMQPPPEQVEQQNALNDEIRAHQGFTDAATGVNVKTRLTQQDVLALAAKAADAAPQHAKADAYAAVLREHGLHRMQQAPAQ